MSTDGMERKTAKSSARYHKLTRSGDDGFIDLQFEKPPPQIPYKAIILAIILLVVGTLLIIIGAFLIAGVIDTKVIDNV